MGLNERSGANVVAINHLLFAKPVTKAGLAVTPGSGSPVRATGLDLVIGLEAAAGSPTGGRILFDGADVTSYLAGSRVARRPALSPGGGLALRCARPRGWLAAGDHVLPVVVTLANHTSRRHAVRSTVVANTAP